MAGKMSGAGDNSKPRVLVLGGCGFIGRNLVEHLITNDLVSGLRVVDKTPPQLAFLNPNHTKVFEDPRVEYKSANLINTTSCAAALDPGDGSPWGLVANCAGETRVGQTEAVYSEGIYTLSTNVAKQCANQRVPRLVEISSGYMYSTDKPHKEDGPIEPWTVEGRMKSKVEQELEDLKELNYTIIRPAIVYGIGDRRSLTPRLLYGGIYKHLGETMKLLWTGDLKTNTVHVHDVCRAIWTLGTDPAANRQTYNVVDEANSTQGSLAEMVAQIFNINVDYYGTAISTIAKVWADKKYNAKKTSAECRRSASATGGGPSTAPNLTESELKVLSIMGEDYGQSQTSARVPAFNEQDIAGVADEANDKHLTAWADICRRYSLAHTPLEPSASVELLLNKQLCLDGSKVASLLQLDVPRPTVDKLREVLEDYAAMNLFPKELLL